MNVSGIQRHFHASSRQKLGTSTAKSRVRFQSVWFGSVRFGPVRFGSARFGSVRFGSVRFGSVRMLNETSRLVVRTFLLSRATAAAAAAAAVAAQCIGPTRFSRGSGPARTCRCTSLVLAPRSTSSGNDSPSVHPSSQPAIGAVYI